MISAIRHTTRLMRIGFVLARHDALFPLYDPPAPAFVRGAARAAAWLLRRRQADGRPGERLAMALTVLGPSFIKLGQTLSTRSDLFGAQVADDLALLQDRLPPFPGHIAFETIEAELGKPVAELFAEIDPVAVAAASIAQVHLAETTDGRAVAVKVLRPGVEHEFERDIAMLRWLAHWAWRLSRKGRRLKPIEVVEAFAETVRAEMDLRLEAAAASELGDNFHDADDFDTPEIDWVRTGRRVLTLERVAGARVDDTDALDAKGHDRHAIMRIAAGAFFRQVFEHGFFHADMHPGNVFVRDDGGLMVIDFGIMGRLDRNTREYLADMLLGMLTRDYELVADVHFRAGYVPAHQSRAAFAQAVRSIAEPILGRPLHEISLGRLLQQLFQITEAFEMETQPQLLLLQKTLLMAEGMGRRLDPTVNMWTLSQPLIEEWMRDHRGPEARVAGVLADVGDAALRLPRVLVRMEAMLEERTDDPPHSPNQNRPFFKQWQLWLIVAALGWGAFFLA
ncbi:MAG: 2-polyprenylphenol 6-hydroxylase [Alphaproteobacteria bacterium]|jgi:ubiquinone biosynthesis protein|nr:2-polyprenylphenol 6-hydroxylase [Alphaproteobacteria bacterium]